MVQTTVYRELSEGVEGNFYDNSPRRVAGYNLSGKAEVQATGQILVGSTNPSANDTVSIAGQVYKFVASLSSANDVLIGASASASTTNLINAINGGTGAGTTYHADTPKNAYVEAIVNGDTNTTIDLTAIEGGASGNNINLATTIATGSVVAMAGGVNPTYPTIARAFTFNSENNAVQGGSGVFCGVLVNSKEYANKNGVGNASLQLYNGVQGSLCTMGRIFVKSATQVQVGYVAAFNQNDGSINAYANAGSIPAGFTQIANAKFILKNVNAGSNLCAILELN